MAFEMFRELWEHQNASAKNRAKAMQKELSLADRKIGQLLDRIVDANNDTLIQAYEKRVKDLESHKIEMKGKIDNCDRPAEDFGKFFRTAFEFLANPCNLWDSNRLEDRRAVLKMVFAEKLPYHRIEGFRTAKTTLPFNVLGDFSLGKNGMVSPSGFEPETS